jgi:hypothetical protein
LPGEAELAHCQRDADVSKLDRELLQLAMFGQVNLSRVLVPLIAASAVHPRLA